MKTKFLLIIFSVSLLLNSCRKEEGTKTYTIYRPTYAIKQKVKDDAKLQTATALKDLGNFVLYNNTMFISEKSKGIHVIDYSTPTNPINKGFIPVPGNTGLSIKNNILYADCYMDLFVFNILAADKIELQNTLPSVFLSRLNFGGFDTNAVAVRYDKKDTTVSLTAYNQNNGCINCELFDSGVNSGSLPSAQSANVGGGISVGSSMAVFTIVKDHLYTIENMNLNTFSIADALHPSLVNTQVVSFNMETIFPFKDKLFLGSMSGMFIYGLGNPAAPQFISKFEHVRVCDPVIADDNFAFVTLRGGSRCGGFTNELDILNIENLNNPFLIKTYPFSNPHGLSKDGKVLFICDGSSGLKIIDASDINNLQSKQVLAIGNVLDVVAFDQKAFVMLDEGIKIYSYDQQFKVSLLGSINKN